MEELLEEDDAPSCIFHREDSDEEGSNGSSLFISFTLGWITTSVSIPFNFTPSSISKFSTRGSRVWPNDSITLCRKFLFSSLSIGDSLASTFTSFINWSKDAVISSAVKLGTLVDPLSLSGPCFLSKDVGSGVLNSI